VSLLYPALVSLACMSALLHTLSGELSVVIIPGFTSLYVSSSHKQRSHLITAVLPRVSCAECSNGCGPDCLFAFKSVTFDIILVRPATMQFSPHSSPTPQVFSGSELHKFGGFQPHAKLFSTGTFILEFEKTSKLQG